MQQSPNNFGIKSQIKERAFALGFNDIGILQLENSPRIMEKLYEFLKEGRHGEMHWMERSADSRVNPYRMWPEARTAILLGLNYSPQDNPLDVLKMKDRGAISVYAQGADYHTILREKAELLISSLEFICEAQYRIFVDTAPLMEKPLAASAGIGWQGKHTNLVSRTYGSWLFLCVILTNAVIVSDNPSEDHCGTCQRCLDVCPTNAFPAPYQLDARRCISYLTIEYKKQIPKEFRTQIGNRIFGCDDCLAVCPWNKFAKKGNEAQLQASPNGNNPPLKELLSLTEETFRNRFNKTAIKRTGRDRFLRNVLIATGNSGDKTLISSVRALLRDPSPLVRGMAVWAAYKLLPHKEFLQERIKHLPLETNVTVIEEWQMEAS